MPNEESCSIFDIAEVPGILTKPRNCGAGIVIPPSEPPPPNSAMCRKVTIYEKGDSKLFTLLLHSLFGVYYGVSEVLTKYYEPSLPDDLWGPPLLGFYLPAELRRGDKIYYIGNLMAGSPLKGNRVYWASTLGGPPPGFYNNTMVYMQLGSIFVSDSYSPREEMRHMGPDTFLFYCPQFWRSKSSVNIMSWSPFYAEVCLTNEVEGFPAYSQLRYETPHYYQMSSAAFASPDCGTYGGQKTTLVFKEVFQPGGYPCPYWPSYAGFGSYVGMEINPGDILGWQPPPDPPTEPGILT